MADHSYNSAIVDGIICIGVKERRLQNCCREHDLVVSRVVVSIDRLGRHVPFLFVHRFSCLREHVVMLPKCNINAVFDQFVRLDVDARIILPCIRITDLPCKGSQFLFGFLLGCRAHPAEFIDTSVIYRTHIFYHLRDLFLG